MNDKKERVYSEEDLCEYTILQKIDELEKQLKNIKNEFNDLYETKEAAYSTHKLLRSNDAKINNRIDGLYNITPTDLIASANKLSLGVENTALGNGVNLSGFIYDEATKTLKASGGGIVAKSISLSVKIPSGTYTAGQCTYITDKAKLLTDTRETIAYIPNIQCFSYPSNDDAQFICIYKEAFEYNNYIRIAFIMQCIKDAIISEDSNYGIEVTRLIKA